MIGALLRRWRDRPDPALARYAAAMTTRAAVGTYDYDRAIAGKRRAEQQQAAATLAHAVRSTPRLGPTNLVPLRRWERA